jgi:Class II flagellar assembly regulator
MRVTDKPPVNPVTGTTTVQRTAGTSARFSLGSTDAAGRPSSAQAAAPAGALDGMIALQAAGDSLERRKRAVKKGFGLLDSLDQLKIALLSGRVPTASLESMLVQLKQRRESADDPQLDDVLAHIELRAGVELAKLGKS